MNQKQAKEIKQIPHLGYSDKFLIASRELANNVRNIERAYDRILKRGKTN